ncbi:MAG: class I SAM-dependent methyltransferase [Rhodospirillales bacterium]|nr:class I SAM-dependent methyltransferase [Alphaproteobacteria bacterium]MBL6947758.1 class I SAM-dependent methyltransferase [Rhodospirillales bacterium]
MPLIIALGCQAIGGLVAFGGALALSRTAGWQPPLPAVLAVHAAVAAVSGRRLGLAGWWIPIQLAFPFAVALTLAWRIPGWVFLAAFAASVLVFWNSFRGGVPLYLSNTATKTALAGLLPDDGPFRFADLGCGLGGPVLALSRLKPEGRFSGLESAPLLFLASWLRWRLAGSANVEILPSDFWQRNLGDFDFVYCFLSPVPMPELYEKARREMKPGSLLISNSFEVPGHSADSIIEVSDARQTKLHLWHM